MTINVLTDLLILIFRYLGGFWKGEESVVVKCG